MNIFINKNTCVDIAYAQCEVHLLNGSTIIGTQLNRENMLAGNNHIPNVATIIRRSVFFDVGWYDPRIVMVRINDWDFLQRCIISDVNFAYLPKVLTHEHGVALTESLGNSYDLQFDIIKKIANSDRSKELHPGCVANVNPISLPQGVSLSNAQLEDFLRLQIEFAVLGCRDDIFKSISESELFADLSLPLKNWKRLIQWWAIVTQERWRKKLENKDLSIQEKQAYIDKQQSYIDNSHIKTYSQNGQSHNKLIKTDILTTTIIGSFLRRLGIFK